MIQSLVAAVPDAYLLFKAQSLPPLMVWFTAGELMGVGGGVGWGAEKEQNVI